MRIERALAPRIATKTEIPPPKKLDLFERVSGSRARRVFRIVYEKPNALSAYLYGAEVLYDDGAKKRKPLRVDGVVVHNDVREDPRAFVGTHNPALHAKAWDKWEEHVFLEKHAPHLSPRTIELPAAPLTGLQRTLDRELGTWILKPRSGFGSDGALPTDEDDLAELHADYVANVAPEYERLARETRDPDALVERVSEELDGAEGRVLAQYLEDPASVIAQERITGAKELRVHAVEGRILTGATTSRWWEPDNLPTRDELARAERAIARLLASAPGLSFACDLLITREGRIAIIDLNLGLDSGMYHPESDVFITNLLAERLGGRETPYLRELRAFERAPLAKKLEHALAIEAKIGAFVRAHEAFGFYDRIVDVYLDEGRRDPKEAWRQLALIPGLDPEERARFASELRWNPNAADLEPARSVADR